MLFPIVTMTANSSLSQPLSVQHKNLSNDDTTFFSALVNKMQESGQSELFLNESENTDRDLNNFLTLLLALSENDWKELLGDDAYQFLQTNIEEWQEMVRLENLTAEEAIFALLQHLILTTESTGLLYEEANGFHNLKQLINFFSANGSVDNHSTMNNPANHKTSTPIEMSGRLYSLLTSQVTTEQKSQVNMPINQSNQTAYNRINEAINRFIERAVGQVNQQGNANRAEQKNSGFPLQQPLSFQSGLMDQVQQLELHTQLKSNLGKPNFAEQLEKMFAASRLQTFRNGTTALNVKLYPEHLGSLTIKLVHSNGELIARITAETASARQLIESQIHQLRHAFINQQINVEKIEVLQLQQQNLQNNQQQESKSGQGRNNESRYEDSQNERDEYESSEEENTFQAWLNALSV